MKKIAIITMAALLSAVVFIIAGHMPGNDGVVARRTLPDGTQVLVTQKHASGGYEVGLYFREPHYEWGWCYLDHDDSSWFRGRIDYDPTSDVVTVRRGGTIRAVWDRKNKQYTRPNVQGWKSVAPQDYRPPPFSDGS